MMPWNELGGMHAESTAIAAQLRALNRAGFLTINSQPRINAAPSEDPHVGWGGPSGCAAAPPLPPDSQAGAC